MKAYGPFIFFVITALACPLSAQQGPPPHVAEIDRVYGRLLGAGFREESDTLRTALYIRGIINKPADRFAESVPPCVARNRLVQAWLFGAPRDRGREEVGRFERAMRRQYRNPSPVLLMWLRGQGIRDVANGDYDPADLALIMNSYWVPALRERVAMTNQYASGSSRMADLCLITPPESRDVAAALGAADADRQRQKKNAGEKLDALFSYWSERTEEVAKFPVYLHTYNAARLYQQGRFAEAAEVCKRLIEEDKPRHSALIHRCWADSLWRSGRRGEARAVLGAGLDKSANTALLLLEAEYALHDGDPAKARESLRFLARQPENPAGQMLLARAAAEEGRVAEWLDAAVQTLFYSYGWEDDYFGPALNAADMAISRAIKIKTGVPATLSDAPMP